MDRVAGELGEDFDAGGRVSFLSVRAKSEDQNKSVDDWSVGEWKERADGRSNVMEWWSASSAVVAAAVEAEVEAPAATATVIGVGTGLGLK